MSGPCQHCGAEHAAKALLCPRTRESMASPGLLGAQIDRYVTEAFLGSGTFSAVYRAHHVHTGVKVALKVLRRSLEADGDDTVVERFLREARAAAAVGNDHIVQVVDAGQSAEGVSFVALEFLEGMGLDVLLRRRDVPAPRAVALCDQVLEALITAHAKGIIHRDMKPANVFIVERGGADFVKLLDFGISKMHAKDVRSLTMTGTVMGTPAYMAPEQFLDASSVDQRADVYSVAVMLYELLAGKKPLEAASYAEMLVKVQTEQPAPLKDAVMGLSAALVSCVMKGLEKDRALRWASALEFRAALSAAKAKGLFAPVAPSDAATVLMDDTERLPAPAATIVKVPAVRDVTVLLPPPDATLPPRAVETTPPSVGRSPWPLVAIVALSLVVIASAIVLLR